MADMDTTKGKQQQSADGVKPKSEDRLAAEATFKWAWARVDPNDAEMVAELRDLEEKIYEGIDDLENGNYRTYHIGDPFEKFLEDVRSAGREHRARNAKPLNAKPLDG